MAAKWIKVVVGAALVVYKLQTVAADDDCINNVVKKHHSHT